MSTAPLLVGLSFGSSSLLVSVSRFGSSVEVLANAAGDRSTPAVVAFTDRETLVGSAALAQATTNDVNTINRLASLVCADSHQQVTGVSYDVSTGSSGVEVSIRLNGKAEVWESPKILSLLLKSLHKMGLGHLGADLNSSQRLPCVLSLPIAWESEKFAGARRRYKLAAENAGFEVLGFLNEPAAVLISHGLDVPHERDENALVMDFGCSRLGLSFFAVSASGLFSLRHHSEINTLGGDQFDEVLFKHFSKEFSKQNGCEIAENPRAVKRLYGECEASKRVLSASTSAFVDCDSLHGGFDFSSKITRAKFEVLSREILSALTEALEKALKESGLERSAIHRILLAGGSARIPRVQALVKNFFQREPEFHHNTDESVAIGCAKEAIRISKVNKQEELEKKQTAAQATTLSIGVADASGKFIPLVPRGAILPAKAIFLVEPQNGKKTAALELFEGESEVARENRPLGRIFLSVAQAISVKVEVSLTGEILLQAGNSALAISAEAGKRISFEEAKKLAEEQINKNKQRAEKATEQVEEDETPVAAAIPAVAEVVAATAELAIDDLD